MRQNRKPVNVWIVRTTGEAVRVDDAPFVHYEDTGWELSLKWAKEQIGNDCSLAELVRLPYGDLWVDEEGLCKPDPQLNGMATAIYQSLYGGGHPIVGNVVIVLHPGHRAEERMNAILSKLVRN